MIDDGVVKDISGIFINKVSAGTLNSPLLRLFSFFDFAFLNFLDKNPATSLHNG
jgi:hypothetical protein